MTIRTASSMQAEETCSAAACSSVFKEYKSVKKGYGSLAVSLSFT